MGKNAKLLMEKGNFVNTLNVRATFLSDFAKWTCIVGNYGYN